MQTARQKSLDDFKDLFHPSNLYDSMMIETDNFSKEYMNLQ